MGVPIRGRGAVGRLVMRRGGRNRGAVAGGRGGVVFRGGPRGGIARGKIDENQFVFFLIRWPSYFWIHDFILIFTTTGRGGLRGRGGFAGRGGRGRGGRGRGVGRPAVTREQLDNQLDAYMSKTKGHLDAELDAYMAQADPDGMEWFSSPFFFLYGLWRRITSRDTAKIYTWTQNYSLVHLIPE